MYEPSVKITEEIGDGIRISHEDEVTNIGLNYTIWVEAETVAEAEQEIESILRELYRSKRIYDWDGRL